MTVNELVNGIKKQIQLGKLTGNEWLSCLSTTNDDKIISIRPVMDFILDDVGVCGECLFILSPVNQEDLKEEGEKICPTR